MFKESCSNYVYRVTSEEGLKKGLIALKYRYRNCRPNYYLSEDNGKVLLITVEREVIEEPFIDKKIFDIPEHADPPEDR